MVMFTHHLFLAKLDGSPKKVASGNVNDAPLTLKTDSSSGFKII